MSINKSVLALPITFAEIKEYLWLFKIDLPLWERRVILEVDDAILPILNKISGGRGASDKPVREQYARDDVAGIKHMMSSLSKKAPKHG